MCVDDISLPTFILSVTENVYVNAKCADGLLSASVVSFTPVQLHFQLIRKDELIAIGCSVFLLENLLKTV